MSVGDRKSGRDSLRSSRRRSWPLIRALAAWNITVYRMVPLPGLLSSLLVVASGEPREPAPTFVILAPAEWRAALEPLATARARDFAVELVAVEDVLASEEGADPPERLKRYLWRAWRERRATHVLLVGDADVFPVRFMVLDRCTEPAFHTAFYPSDLYYADVAETDGSFDDWNAERDGHHARYFGEVHGECTKDTRIDFDRASYAPELAVGRFPVSTRAELEAVVAKTVAWRAAAESGALLVHADGWIDERARVEGFASELGRAGFSLERQFYGSGTAEAPVPSPASVLAGLRRSPLIAYHLGHGSEETWHDCLGPAERDALAHERPAVFVSVGCSTAHFVVEPPYQPYLDVDGVLHRGTNDGERFTAPPPPPHWLQPARFDHTGLGERLLLMPQGGAVAYIGCTTGAQPAAVTLMEGFNRALATSPRPRAGDAWRAALAHFVAAERVHELVPDDGWYPPSIFFQGMKFAFFGDPTLPLD
jgi:hypothetical protein